MKGKNKERLYGRTKSNTLPEQDTMKKNFVSFLINFILLITLMFSWAGHDAGTSGYNVDGARSYVGAMGMLKGQVHPISSTPVEKSESVERVAKTEGLFCHAGLLWLVFTTVAGFFFLLAPCKSLCRLYYVCVRKRDYRIEYIHNKDGDKEVSPLYFDDNCIQRRNHESNSRKWFDSCYGRHSCGCHGGCRYLGKQTGY